MVYEPIREIRWTNQKGKTAVSEVKNGRKAEFRMLRRHYPISAGDRFQCRWVVAVYTLQHYELTSKGPITQKYRYLSFGHSLSVCRIIEV